MLYELLYIISSKFSEEELKPIMEKAAGLIEKSGGKISKNENLGRLKLAYPIKRVQQGYYILVEFEIEPSAIKKLDKDLRLMSEILRYQVVKISHPRPVVVRKAKESEQEKPDFPEKIIVQPEKKKVSLEELDKKLDEILGGDVT